MGRLQLLGVGLGWRGLGMGPRDGGVQGHGRAEKKNLLC